MQILTCSYFLPTRLMIRFPQMRPLTGYQQGKVQNRMLKPKFVPQEFPPVTLQGLATYGRALTAQDVAELFNLSVPKIYEDARAGVIPCTRIGTSVRFDPKKLAAWWNSR